MRLKFLQFQTSTASEDGPAFGKDLHKGSLSDANIHLVIVTQCPISQFNSYMYEIPLDQQTGTFWYEISAAPRAILMVEIP